jgi:4-diphosphocytidyl-2-C-methyl-D-erythritol kinase
MRPAENLAYRAAALLRDWAGGPVLGARIELRKVIPADAGLGGGSSDAAAALRALNRLWGLGLPASELSRLAAQLGADVPFFLFGGTALGCGRGDEVTPLPDVPSRRLLLVVPRRRPARKTAAMYAHLRPEHFGHGEASERLATSIRGGAAPSDDDVCNTFEGIAAEVSPEAAAAAERCRALGLRPHLAGSGPAQFVLLRPDADSAPLREALTAAGFDVFEATTMAASAATAIMEEP